MAVGPPIHIYLKSAWLDPRLRIAPSPLGGRGSFANTQIRQDEVVTIWGAEPFTKGEIDRGAARGRTVHRMDDGVYLAYEPYDRTAPDHFLNHSCAPNLWMADAVTLTAMRDIATGEELTADYILWEVDEDWISRWSCACGAGSCRGRITGRDWRLPELQKRYRGHFVPWINARIEHTAQG